MSKTKKNSDQFQLDLFNQPTLNIISRLKAAMREAIRRCRLSRDQIAEKITEAIHIDGLKFPGNSRAISKAILDKWVSESSTHIIPLALLPVFCMVVEDYLPIQILIRPLGITAIGERERKLLEWAEAEIKRREASETVRKIEEEIGI